MIFNSLPFLVFVAIFIPLYFALKGRARLLLALAGSYLFYGWWDWRFLSLIAISTLVDFWVGAATCCRIALGQYSPPESKPGPWT